MNPVPNLKNTMASNQRHQLFPNQTINRASHNSQLWIRRYLIIASVTLHHLLLLAVLVGQVSMKPIP